MADNEQIGGVSIGITGDYSTLAADFAQAQQLAQRAGQGIASALDVAMARADGLTTAVAATSGAVYGAATALDHFSQESGLAGGELNIFRTVLQASLDTGMGLVETFREMAGSADSLGPAVANVSKAFADQMAAAQAAAGADDEVSASMQRVRSDAEKFEQAWESAIAEDRKRATEAQKNAATFEKAWSDAIKENQARNDAAFKAFANSVEQGISHPLQFAGAQVKEFMLALGPLGVTALGVAAGIAAVGYEAFTLVKEAGAAAEATGNLADRLNLTWHQTRELEEMGQIAGVSINGLQMASFRLAEALEDASGSGKKVADALDKLGVAGSTSGELLSGLLEKLAQIPDATERIAKAHDIMGRASQQIIPLIKNYGELQAAVRSLGGSIDDDMAAKLQHADDELDKLSIAWKHLKEAFAEKLTPVIEFVVKQATDTVSGNDHGMNPGLVMAGGSGTEAMRKLHDAQMELQAQAERDKAAVDATFGAYMRDVGTFEADAAHAWSEAHSKTLAGMKQALTDTTKEIATLASLLSRSDPNRDADQAKYNAALAKQAQLQQAIADASVKDSDIKQKTIKFQTAGAEVLSILLADAANKYRQVAQEIAGVILAWQGLTGQVLTPWQVLQRDSEAAARSIADLKEHALDLAPPLTSIGDIAMQVGKSIEGVGIAAQTAVDKSAWSKLDDLMGKLGLQSQHAAEEAYKTALAIANEIEMLYELGVAGSGDVTQAAEKVAQLHKQLQDIINGTTATAKVAAGHISEFGRQLESVFKSVGSQLADVIVDGKNLSDAFKEIGKSILKTLIQDVVQTGFGALFSAISKGQGMLGALGKSLGGLFGGGGGGGAAGAAGGAPGGSAATGATGAIGGSLTGIVSAVSGVATAISSIIGNFQMAGMNKTLDLIEKSARYTEIYTGEQPDSILATAHRIAESLRLMGADLKGMVGINLTGTISADKANGLLDSLVNSSQNLYFTAATTLLEIRDSIRGGDQLLLGQLSQIAKGSNPSMIQRLLSGGGLFGLGGIGTGIGTAVSGVAGAMADVLTAPFKAIASIFGGDDSGAMDAIVLHTLQTANDLANLRSDEWARHTGLMMKLDDLWASIRNIGHVDGGGTVFNITGNTFSGGASQADADRIGQAIVTQLQRAGAIRQ